MRLISRSTRYEKSQMMIKVGNTVISGEVVWSSFEILIIKSSPMLLCKR
jgi:hypothetical protein